MLRLRSIALTAALLVSFLANPARSAPVTTVPFHLIGTAIVLPVQIASSDTLWFALDTGAASGSVNLEVAEKLGMEMGGNSVAQGAAGSVSSRQLKPFKMKIGAITLENQHGSTFPLIGLAPRMGHELDGIVGSELFRRYVVEVDYSHSALRLYEPSDYHYGGTGERLPLTFTSNLPYIHAAIDLSDGRRLEGRFVIDTGSTQGVILMPLFAQQESVAATVKKSVAMIGQAVGGQTQSRTGRLAGIELGSLRLNKPLVSISQGGPAHFAVEGSAGNVGGAILKKFRCTFDYSRSEMILEPVSDLSDPIPFDASGIVFVTQGAAFDTILVSRVIPESPADEAGIQVGDRLISIDGTPAAEVGVQRLRERLRRTGDSVTLAVARGAQTLTVPLRLRDLL